MFDLTMKIMRIVLHLCKFSNRNTKKDFELHLRNGHVYKDHHLRVDLTQDQTKETKVIKSRAQNLLFEIDLA